MNLIFSVYDLFSGIENGASNIFEIDYPEVIAHVENTLETHGPATTLLVMLDVLCSESYNLGMSNFDMRLLNIADSTVGHEASIFELYREKRIFDHALEDSSLTKFVRQDFIPVMRSLNVVRNSSGERSDTYLNAFSSGAMLLFFNIYRLALRMDINVDLAFSRIRDKFLTIGILDEVEADAQIEYFRDEHGIELFKRQFEKKGIKGYVLLIKETLYTPDGKIFETKNMLVTKQDLQEFLDATVLS